MRADVRKDQKWASEYRDDVMEVLGRHLGKIVSIRRATEHEDCKQGTDLVVEVAAGTTAVRIRDNRRTFRDWTIRSRRDSGAETELAKLKNGWGRWYLYCWCKADGRIGDYVIIDLDLARGARLLDGDWPEQPNGDGTYFIAIPVPELRHHGVLLVDECKSPCPQPRGGYVPPVSVKQSGEQVPDVAPVARPQPQPGTRQRFLFPAPTFDRADP